MNVSLIYLNFMLVGVLIITNEIFNLFYYHKLLKFIFSNITKKIKNKNRNEMLNLLRQNVVF